MNAPLPLGAMRAESTGLQLQVRSIRLAAQGIHAFELVHPLGEALPEVEAGAHVDLQLPGGLVRSYSLAGDPRDRSCWTLGVLREAQGRGGSRALHDSVRVGELLGVGAPRNAFGLKPGTGHCILLAGGIGVTPLKAMAHVLAHEGRPFEFHYCARSARHAAFTEELRALVPAASLHFHFDDGDPSRGLDIAGLLAEPRPGQQVYYCGPGGFMKACADAAAAAAWPADCVHSEHFKAPEPKPRCTPDGAFEVRLARSGGAVQVLPEQSIVRALELAGHRVPTSCLSGLCGACKVNYLDGEVDHQDYILSDDEKRSCMTVCVSRAKSEVLVLDL